MTNGLNNWAISTLLKYEACPYQVKLSKIDKLPEPPRDPKNDPLARGSEIHTALEHVVLHGDAVPKVAEAFTKQLLHARTLYLEGMATAEQNWWFDKDWGVCERPKVWLWAKLDLNVTDEARRVVVSVDYKTGRSGYKAIDHVQQMQLYGAAGALKYPWAETIYAELWYIDEGWVKGMEFTREHALRYVGMFQSRADRMMNDQNFRPNPSKYTCRYCPYSPRGTGACPVGV